MVLASHPPVTNELESAEHLANGEEADALSEDDAAGDELGAVHATYRVKKPRLGDALEELTRRLEGFPCVPEVGLESCNRSTNPLSVLSG